MINALEHQEAILFSDVTCMTNPTHFHECIKLTTSYKKQRNSIFARNQNVKSYVLVVLTHDIDCSYIEHN